MNDNQPQPVQKNEQTITVPAELWPLAGEVTIPLYLSPQMFHEFWKRVQAQNEDAEKHHLIISTYHTRLPLIVRANLTFFDQPLPLPENGLDLPAQEIAAFIVSITTPLVNKATRGPNLPLPSKNGATAAAL